MMKYTTEKEILIRKLIRINIGGLLVNRCRSLSVCPSNTHLALNFSVCAKRYLMQSKNLFRMMLGHGGSEERSINLSTPFAQIPSYSFSRISLNRGSH